MQRTPSKLLTPAAELIAGRGEIERYWRTGIELGLTNLELERLELQVRGPIAVEIGRCTGGDDAHAQDQGWVGQAREAQACAQGQLVGAGDEPRRHASQGQQKIATGKLAKLSGNGKVTLKIKRRLKPGKYTVALFAKDAKGGTVGGTTPLKIKK